jgi:hypothetical protein
LRPAQVPVKLIVWDPVDVVQKAVIEFITGGGNPPLVTYEPGTVETNIFTFTPVPEADAVKYAPDATLATGYWDKQIDP